MICKKFFNILKKLIININKLKNDYWTLLIHSFLSTYYLNSRSSISSCIQNINNHSHTNVWNGASFYWSSVSESYLFFSPAQTLSHTHQSADSSRINLNPGRISTLPRKSRDLPPDPRRRSSSQHRWKATLQGRNRQTPPSSVAVLLLFPHARPRCHHRIRQRPWCGFLVRSTGVHTGDIYSLVKVPNNATTKFVIYNQIL